MIWERTAFTLAAYVKAHHPWWSGVGDPRMMTLGPTVYGQKPRVTPTRTNTVIVRKAAIDNT